MAAKSPRNPWLPRLLFRSCWLAAAALVVLVLGCPLLDGGSEPSPGWGRLIALFARDVVVRRTALASAAGLCATACVFFRTPRPAPARGAARPRVPPPTDVVGA